MGATSRPKGRRRGRLRSVIYNSAVDPARVSGSKPRGGTEGATVARLGAGTKLAPRHGAAALSSGLLSKWIGRREDPIFGAVDGHQTDDRASPVARHPLRGMDRGPWPPGPRRRDPQPRSDRQSKGILRTVRRPPSGAPRFRFSFASLPAQHWPRSSRGVAEIVRQAGALSSAPSRHLAQRLPDVLAEPPRRHPGPAPERMMERAWILVSEQCCNRLSPVDTLLEIASGELAAEFVHEHLEACPLLSQPPAERAAARAEAAGDAVERACCRVRARRSRSRPSAEISRVGQRSHPLAADLLEEIEQVKIGADGAQCELLLFQHNGGARLPSANRSPEQAPVLGLIVTTIERQLDPRWRQHCPGEQPGHPYQAARTQAAWPMPMRSEGWSGWQTLPHFAQTLPPGNQLGRLERTLGLQLGRRRCWTSRRRRHRRSERDGSFVLVDGRLSCFSVAASRWVCVRRATDLPGVATRCALGPSCDVARRAGPSAHRG